MRKYKAILTLLAVPASAEPSVAPAPAAPSAPAAPLAVTAKLVEIPTKFPPDDLARLLDLPLPKSQVGGGAAP